MARLPQALFVVDTKREEIAVREAKKLHIPVIGLVDTNCDPDMIDFPIPGNDDALKSIRVITTHLAEAILQGRKEFLEAETVRRKAEASEAQKGSSKGKKASVPAAAASARGASGGKPVAPTGPADGKAA